jgi:hypothetical protein
MNLSDAAKLARANADASLDPADHAVAAALESWLDCEARDQLRELEPEPPDPSTFPTAEQSGFVSVVRIEKPGRRELSLRPFHALAVGRRVGVRAQPAAYDRGAALGGGSAFR